MENKQLNIIMQEIDIILKGIDSDISPDGWWETSDGVEFGKRKKEEIKELFRKYIKEDSKVEEVKQIEYILPSVAFSPNIVGINDWVICSKLNEIIEVVNKILSDKNR